MDVRPQLDKVTSFLSYCDMESNLVHQVWLQETSTHQMQAWVFMTMFLREISKGPMRTTFQDLSILSVLRTSL